MNDRALARGMNEFLKHRESGQILDYGFADPSISNLQIERFQRVIVHPEEVWLDSHRLHQLPKLLGCPHECEGCRSIPINRFANYFNSKFIVLWWCD